MESAVLPSTLLLTLLLAIGLFFFIRASVKDRIEVARLISDRPDEILKKQLQQYFAQRSYRVVQLDAEQDKVTFEGFVAPSLFLAVFLTALAALGLLCLGLVLSTALHGTALVVVVPVLFSPWAGWFYWTKAGRLEQVVLKIEALGNEGGDRSALQITAHRDELADLQRLLELKPLQ